MATYSSYSDALANAPIGSTISYSQDGGLSVDESTSEYELIGDQAPLNTPAESAALDNDNGSSGADTSGGGFSVPEEFRTDENYGPTSTGSNGGSESPPDNGGYTNPPRIGDTGSGRDVGITGGGSSSNDPVSGGGGFSVPEIFRIDNIYSPPAEEPTQDGGGITDRLSNLSDSLSGGLTVEDLTGFDADTAAPLPPADEPVSSDGPSWLTYGLAAAIAVVGGFIITRQS